MKRGKSDFNPLGDFLSKSADKFKSSKPMKLIDLESEMMGTNSTGVLKDTHHAQCKISLSMKGYHQIRQMLALKLSCLMTAGQVFISNKSNE